MRRNKYGAKPTTVDGIRFASMREAARYQELKMLEKAGHVERLKLQPAYECRVSPSYDQRGMELTIGTYRGDFHYFDVQTKKYVVEDVKGFKTPLYRWKKKHVEAQYGIEIREI